MADKDEGEEGEEGGIYEKEGREELVEDDQEPIDGKATEPAIANTDEVRLVHAAAGLGLAGRQAFIVQGADAAGSENRFCLTDTGVGMPEVAVDVLARSSTSNRQVGAGCAGLRRIVGGGTSCGVYSYRPFQGS